MPDQNAATFGRLLTNKQDVAASKIVSGPALSADDGEAIMTLERFALTTNNITYAAFGDAMRYWEFFPSGEAGWGHMPVWGIARVTESNVADIQPGQRFYGYYPIADHLLCKPHRISERGFADSTDYRQPLPSAYNYYARRSADGTNSTQHENYEMLIRPLFLTSYMLADYLHDNQYFGAKQIVFSSASSKTAYASAHCLAGLSIPLIGLTSPRNQAFVQRTQCYSDVVIYDELEYIDNSAPTLYVDFQGSEPLRGRVHEHFAPNLKHDCFVGSAGNLEPPQRNQSSDIETKFFFAAEHINKMNREVGAVRVNEQMTAAQDRFIETISTGDEPWLRVVENAGFESAEKVIRQLCENQIAADEGHVVVLNR